MFWTGNPFQSTFVSGTSLADITTSLVGGSTASQLWLRDSRVNYKIVNNNNQTLRVQVCVLQCRRDMMDRPAENCDPLWLLQNNPLQANWASVDAEDSGFNWRFQSPEFKLYWKPQKFYSKVMEPGTQWDLNITKKANIKLMFALVSENTTNPTTQFTCLRGLTYAVMVRFIGVPTSHPGALGRLTGYPAADLIGTWEYNARATWITDSSWSYFQLQNTLDPQGNPASLTNPSTVVRTSGAITALGSAN